MKIITAGENLYLNLIARYVEPLITQCDYFFGLDKPFTIKVHNYLFQDDLENGTFYDLDECIILDNDTDMYQYANYPIFEITNFNRITDKKGTLILKNVLYNVSYEVDIEKLLENVDIE